VAHAGVGIERDRAGGVVDEADREADGELAALCLGEDPALQARADVVQLGLADRALEAELSVCRG